MYNETGIESETRPFSNGKGQAMSNIATFKEENNERNLSDEDEYALIDAGDEVSFRENTLKMEQEQQRRAEEFRNELITAIAEKQAMLRELKVEQENEMKKLIEDQKLWAEMENQRKIERERTKKQNLDEASRCVREREEKLEKMKKEMMEEDRRIMEETSMQQKADAMERKVLNYELLKEQQEEIARRKKAAILAKQKQIQEEIDMLRDESQFVGALESTHRAAMSNAQRIVEGGKTAMGLVSESYTVKAKRDEERALAQQLEYDRKQAEDEKNRKRREEYEKRERMAMLEEQIALHQRQKEQEESEATALRLQYQEKMEAEKEKRLQAIQEEEEKKKQYRELLDQQIKENERLKKKERRMTDIERSMNRDLIEHAREALKSKKNEPQVALLSVPTSGTNSASGGRSGSSLRPSRAALREKEKEWSESKQEEFKLPTIETKFVRKPRQPGQL
eukprot:TRINITY_DN646_c0_g1_i1.p1 TRINITY_DN646_c0_g1~~TRINITY_DN646_c0_g1_i1.p1  ORF type:complete len:460 (+),score=223.95 TRINITY_DN646_c0_g1_i1:24-1382(+)